MDRKQTAFEECEQSYIMNTFLKKRSQRKMETAQCK